MSITDPICKHCLKRFETWELFYIHLKEAHNRIPIFTCKICQEKCNGIDEFDKHLTFVHGTNHWYLNLAMNETKRQHEKLLNEVSN